MTTLMNLRMRQRTRMRKEKSENVRIYICNECSMREISDVSNELYDMSEFEN